MTKIYIAVNGTIGIVLIAIIILIIANIVKPLEAVGREFGVLESGDFTSKIDDRYLKGEMTLVFWQTDLSLCVQIFQV